MTDLPHQQTIASPVSWEGVGIHSGDPATLTLRPAEKASGIRFIRDGQLLPLSLSTIHSANRATILKNNAFQVHTPEHILSALYGLDIYHVDIELTSAECPILNGASDKFVEKILDVGTKIVSFGREPLLEIDSPSHIEWKEHAKSFTVLPWETGCRITYIAQYPNTHVGTQIADIQITPESYITDIAPCRTYGFETELQALRDKGLIKGADLNNAILITNEGYSTPLKYSDELARHKVLDILGDIAVIGKKIKGHIIANKTGHEENIALANHLAKLT